MAAHRRTFCENGLFSELLGAGTWLRQAEDTELIYRWLHAGCKLLYTPGSGVLHDRWVDEQENVKLNNSYTLGVVAVFCDYALRGDRLAFRILCYRWGLLISGCCEVWKPARPFYSMYQIGTQFAAFIRGLLGGIYLYLRHPYFSYLSPVKNEKV